jgi:hypothetical protein
MGAVGEPSHGDKNHVLGANRGRARWQLDNVKAEQAVRACRAR